MNWIVLTQEEKNLTDKEGVSALVNHLPSGTFRHDLDQLPYLTEKLGYEPTIMDGSEIVFNDPNLEI